MEFYGSVKANDRFKVVGWFGVVGYGFVGVVKPRSVVVLAILL